MNWNYKVITNMNIWIQKLQVNQNKFESVWCVMSLNYKVAVKFIILLSLNLNICSAMLYGIKIMLPLLQLCNYFSIVLICVNFWNIHNLKRFVWFLNVIHVSNHIFYTNHLISTDNAIFIFKLNRFISSLSIFRF